MSLRQMMSFFIPQGSGEKVCWMKNEKKNCVSVMAVVPGVVPMRRDVDASKVEVLATRARGISSEYGPSSWQSSIIWCCDGWEWEWSHYGNWICGSSLVPRG